MVTSLPATPPKARADDAEGPAADIDGPATAGPPAETPPA